MNVGCYKGNFGKGTGLLCRPGAALLAAVLVLGLSAGSAMAVPGIGQPAPPKASITGGTSVQVLATDIGLNTGQLKVLFAKVRGTAAANDDLGTSVSIVRTGNVTHVRVKTPQVPAARLSSIYLMYEGQNSNLQNFEFTAPPNVGQFATQLNNEFSSLDTNNDGVLDRDEARVAFPELSDEEFTDLFNQTSGNQNTVNPTRLTIAGLLGGFLNGALLRLLNFAIFGLLGLFLTVFSSLFGGTPTFPGPFNDANNAARNDEN